MLTLEFIPELKQRLNSPLPGRDAQLKMASGSRRIYPIVPDNARTACVMIVLYPKNEGLHLVLMERTPNKHDRHSGQISFPGGMLEKTDASLKDGALREVEEEVGIQRDQIEVIGQISELYIPVSNFQVFPFVGYMDGAPSFIAQESEVKTIIEAPIGLLLAQETRQTKDLQIHGITLKDVPFFNVFGHTVWGATAMMLSEFLEILGD